MENIQTVEWVDCGNPPRLDGGYIYTHKNY